MDQIQRTEYPRYYDFLYIPVRRPAVLSVQSYKVVCVKTASFMNWTVGLYYSSYSVDCIYNDLLLHVVVTLNAVSSL